MSDELKAAIQSLSWAIGDLAEAAAKEQANDHVAAKNFRDVAHRFRRGTP